MISNTVHLLSLVPLVITNGFTFWYGRKKIEEMRYALEMKSQLLGESLIPIPAGAMVGKHMLPGDALEVKFTAPVSRIKVEVSAVAHVSVMALS